MRPFYFQTERFPDLGPQRRKRRADIRAALFNQSASVIRTDRTARLEAGDTFGAECADECLTDWFPGLLALLDFS